MLTWGEFKTIKKITSDLQEISETLDTSIVKSLTSKEILLELKSIASKVRALRVLIEKGVED